MINNLDPEAAEIRDMGTAALEWKVSYHDTIRSLPVAPSVGAAELKRRLGEPLPHEGRDFRALLEVFRDVIAAGSRHNGHPRFFGYVSAPGTAVAAIADRLASAIESNLGCARYLAELVDGCDDFEMLAPVGLSIFCMRYLPTGLRGGDLTEGQEREFDRINEQIMVRMQRDGGSYLTNATVAGRFALRGCVLNYRTTREDMRTLLDDVRRAAHATNWERDVSDS